MNLLKEADENFLCGFHDDSIHLYLYYKGGDLVAYEFIWGETVLFNGQDFKPSPLYDIDSMESVV